jgi:tetratricopeptide (TPR) repeat protein
VQHNLALLLQNQGKLAEAEPVYRDLLQRQRQLLPPKHAALASSLVSLGGVLMDSGKAPQAELLIREALAIRQETLPTGHELTAATESLLGACLTALKKYEEAEVLLLRSVAALQAAPGVAATTVRRAQDRLLQLYEAWGRPEQADAWRKKLREAKGAAEKPAP